MLALQQQGEGCLAKEVLQEQVRMGWPGLGQEVQAICREIGLPDATCETVMIEKEAVKEAILIHHHKHLKHEMKGKKLEKMARTDMRRRREYTKFGVEDCRMAFRLETYQFDCRVNMPTKYGRDLRCRGCNPGLIKQEQDIEQEQEEQEQDEQEQEEKEHKEQEHEEQEQFDESQEHLESCPGFSELWQGLGSYSLLTRCRFFQRVKLKRLKQKQQQMTEADDEQHTAEN